MKRARSLSPLFLSRYFLSRRFLARLLLPVLCLFLLLPLAPQAAEENHASDEAPRAQAPAWPECPGIIGGCGIVTDARTGIVLYGKNIHERIYPASTTKLLTALIAYEELSLSDEITFSHDAVFSVPSDGSSVGFNEGETVTVEQALYALLTASDNMAANALGEAVSGSMEAFAEKMTKRAEELGCEETHFSNASGLFDEHHYTSVYDMALIAKAFFENETLAAMSGTRRYEIPPTAKQPDDIIINNGNLFLNGEKSLPGFVGGKTGFTEMARASLVSCAERGGMRLICVVSREETPYQYDDTVTLLESGFKDFFLLSVPETFESPLSAPAFLHAGSTVMGSPADGYRVSSGHVALVPIGAKISDLSREIRFRNVEPDGSIADLVYSYEGVEVGSATLLPVPATAPPTVHTAEPMEEVSGVASFLSRYIQKQNDTWTVDLRAVLLLLFFAAAFLTALFLLFAYLRSYNFAAPRTPSFRRKGKKKSKRPSWHKHWDPYRNYHDIDE